MRKKLFLILFSFITLFNFFSRTVYAETTNQSANTGTSENVATGTVEVGGESAGDSSSDTATDIEGGDGEDNSSQNENSSTVENNPNQNSITIIEKAVNFENLAEYSTDSLERALVYSESTNRDGYEIILGELVSRSGKEKENVIAKLVKEKESIQKEIDELVKKLNNYPSGKKIQKILTKLEKQGKVITAKIIQDYVAEYDGSLAENIKQLINKRKTNIEELSIAASNASAYYKQISKKMESINEAGDPVNVAYGNYINKNSEIKLPSSQYFISRDWNNFSKNDSNTNRSSFGLNWKTSLDSRIIRCKRQDFADVILLYEELLLLIDKDIALINSLKQFDSSGSSWTNDEDEVVKLRDTINENIELINETSDKNAKIDEYNKYDLFGNFSSSEVLEIDYDCIYFIDEKGITNLIKYVEDGRWEDIIDANKNQYKIFSLNKNQEINHDIEAEGGFLVLYKNGFKKYYNEYGLLIKEIASDGSITTFDYENGKITKIHLPFSNEISILRNESGYIKKIYNQFCGENIYQYENDRLISVTYNDKNTVFYEYDKDNDLIRIDNCDRNGEKHFAIQINYEFYSDSSTKKVSSVSNSDGQSEFFKYYEKENKTVHTTYSGFEEIFFYDENRNIIYKKDEFENELRLTVNKNGLVEEFSYNDEITKYFYNENSQLYNIFYKDGSFELFKYDEFGNIIEVQNRDGDVVVSSYNEKSQLIETSLNSKITTKIEYYENNKIKKIIHDSLTEYFEYNAFGLVTLKKVFAPDGKCIKESWKYDDKGRVVEYTNIDGMTTTYEYIAKSTIEHVENLFDKTTYFDFLGNPCKIETFDLQEKSLFIQEYEYNMKSKIIQISLNGEKYKTYSYYNSGLLKSEIEWELIQYLEKKSGNIKPKQGLKKEYFYNKQGHIVQLKKYAVSEDSELSQAKTTDLFTFFDKEKVYIEDYVYEKNGINTEKTTKCESVVVKKEIFNEYGQIIKRINSDGFFEEFKYTPTGKILEVTNSYDERYLYSYKKDGSYIIDYKNASNEVLRYKYNHLNQLFEESDFENQITKYEYDHFGNFLSVKNSYCEKKYSYDEYNRRIVSSVFSVNGDLIFTEETEYQKDKIIIRTGNLYEKIIKTDVYGRIIFIQDENGSNFYSYDVLDRLNIEQDALGNKINYSYSVGNYVSSVMLQDGTTENYKYNYENENQLLQKNSSSNNDYDYVRDSNAKSLKIYKKGNLFRNLQYDEKNRIISEKDVFNNERINRYKNERLSYQKSFSGTELSIFYENNSIIKKYSTGFNEKITKNPINRIVQQKSDSVHVDYKYDVGGKLVSEFDENAKVRVDYFYDKYGRISRIKGNAIDMSFEYDERGLVKKNTDILTNITWSFEYDNRKREIVRFDSQGNKIVTNYLDSGLVESVITYDRFSIVEDAVIYLYDDQNRIEYIFDKNLDLQKITYDQNRVKSLDVPYTDEIYNEEKDKASSSGFIIKNAIPSGRDLAIPQSVADKIRKIATSVGIAKSPKFSQYCWYEDFEYDNRLIKAKTNPFGKTIFTYDSANRVIGINCSNTTNYGIKFEWNSDNLLITESCASYKIQNSYDEHNKINYRRIENFNLNTAEEYFYTYDFFGRLDTERKNQNQVYKYLYSGFSDYVISTLSIGENKVAFDIYSEKPLSASKNNQYKWVNNGYFNSSNGNYRTSSDNEINDSNKKDSSSNSNLNPTMLLSMSEYIVYSSYEKDYDYDGINDDYNTLGIPNSYDCADVVAKINYEVMKKLGMTSKSAVINDFASKIENSSGDLTKEQSIQAAKESVKSTDFINNEDNATTIVSGIQKYEIESNDKTKSQLYRDDDLDKTITGIKENVKIGSVLAWQNNDSSKSWTGHVLTVLAREYDSNGEVCGLVCIQGHTGGNKTEVIYMPLTNAELSSWKGNFAGMVNIESIKNDQCSVKK
jgi:hypothetical protein